MSAIANMPTTEDITLIRDKAVLDNLQIMVERNLQGIKGSSYLLTRMYIAVTQLILNRINADLRQIHQEMRQRRIKITGENQQDDILYFDFTCRGYQDRFGVMREALRTEMSLRLGVYVKAVIEA